MSQSSPSISRRDLLAASTAGAFVAGAGAGGAAGYLYGRGEWERHRGATARAWRELAQRVHGPVLRPWDPSFARTVLPNNLRYASIIPDGVVRCLGARDIAQAILWCREYDVKLVARTGGHSYAGFSTTTGLMIDTTLMDGTAFDPRTGLVRIEGGVLNGGVYLALRENNVAITHGRCPSVGAAGFLLGGGIGFNMRANGVASDQVTASEMVTADGKVRRLGAAADDDLFWACRGGGGGNFGINTAFTMQTFEAPALLTVFQIKWTAKPEDVGLTLMQTLEKTPPTMGTRVSFSAVTPQQQAEGQNVVVNLLGQLRGTKDQLRAMLDPVYRIAAPSSESICEMTYWQGQDFLHEDQPPCYYQERSAFMNRGIGADAIAAGFEHLRVWPGTSSYCDLRFFQSGGTMNTVAPRDTAFVHRASNWLMVVGLYWDEQDNRDPGKMAANHAWQNDFYHAMLPYCGGGAYQNFADPSLTDWRRSYYGENYERLARIKKRVDPGGVFTFAQAV